MTPKKNDNPAALFIMAVVLIGALFSVGRSLLGGMPAPRGRAASASATNSTNTPPTDHGAPIPASDRDPFSSPLLQAASAMQTGASPVAPAGLVPAALRQVTPVRPIQVAGAGVGLSTLRGGVRLRPLIPRPMPIDFGPSAAEEAALARSLRVTAIVMGARPYAVVEPAAGVPRTLHTGERYQALRMVAIRAGEIVLRGRRGLWTLPLATPDSEIGPADGRN